MFRSNRTFAAIALSAITVLTGIGPAAAAPAEKEEHCVVEVLDEKPSGEFVLSDPVCFDTFAEAALAASSGVVRLDAAMTPADLDGAPGVAAVLATFTLGVHYDGYSGSGSSISVVGSNCSGGYWDTPPTWDNRISSTWNGCYRVTHHDLASTGGSSASTVGAGSVHNVPVTLDNKAESISYWSS